MSLPLIFAALIHLFFPNMPSKVDVLKSDQPNIILMMADDMGWGDTGYNGNELIKTPSLDAMAEKGIIFNRFYAAGPVCSPTRGSCLTGRHPSRYGIFTANNGFLKPGEHNLAEILKEEGYTTGHFGKWHLGTLTKFVYDANRGGKTLGSVYSPPWENGFDACFSTESKVPTWDPMIVPSKDALDLGSRMPGESFGTYYWTGPGQIETNNLEGDDSRIIMDRVVPFIQQSVADNKPFFIVIWFHTPHLPVLTGEKYRNLYADQSVDIQHYYGCITAMDEQIGRLNNLLTELGVAENTISFFTSDNGPEGKSKEFRTQGSTKGLLGRKRSLHEGGIRVPGLMTWPKGIKNQQIVDLPVFTSDYLPTIVDVLNVKSNKLVHPLDGESILPYVLEGKKERTNPLFFQFKKQEAVIGNRYKLYSGDEGQTYMFYDIEQDPEEKHNIIEAHTDKAEKMKKALKKWQESCLASNAGKDY